jgi:hypothetical protein
MSAYCPDLQPRFAFSPVALTCACSRFSPSPRYPDLIGVAAIPPPLQTLQTPWTHSSGRPCSLHTLAMGPLFRAGEKTPAPQRTSATTRSILLRRFGIVEAIGEPDEELGDDVEIELIDEADVYLPKVCSPIHPMSINTPTRPLPH